MRDRYETWKSIKVGVLTWNLAGNLPPQNFDVARIVLPETLNAEISLFGDNTISEEVDLYVVGL